MISLTGSIPHRAKYQCHWILPLQNPSVSCMGRIWLGIQLSPFDWSELVQTILQCCVQKDQLFRASCSGTPVVDYDVSFCVYLFILYLFLLLVDWDIHQENYLCLDYPSDWSVVKSTMYVLWNNFAMPLVTWKSTDIQIRISKHLLYREEVNLEVLSRQRWIEKLKFESIMVGWTRG